MSLSSVGSALSGAPFTPPPRESTCTRIMGIPSAVAGGIWGMFRCCTRQGAESADMGITERVVLPSPDETEQLLRTVASSSSRKERLIVRQIREHEYPQVAKVAGEWHKVANQLSDQPELDEPLAEKFSTLSAVAEKMEERLKRASIDGTPIEFYVCEESDELQGMMGIEIQDRALEILLLCSAPRNIDPKLVEKVTGERQPHPVKGVGKALLIRALSRAAESQCSKVAVSAYDDAKGFYARHGFTEISSDPFVTKMVYLRSGAASAAP